MLIQRKSGELLTLSPRHLTEAVGRLSKGTLATTPEGEYHNKPASLRNLPVHGRTLAGTEIFSIEETNMKERITEIDVVRRARKAGAVVPCNAVSKVRRKMGLGRYLRSPNMGWVMTEDEASLLEAELIKRYK